MTRAPSTMRGAMRVAATTLALAAAACASREPPSADRPAPAPPLLDGRSVMVLPIQATRGSAAHGLDAELAFWLADRAPRVEWTFAPALERMVDRSPGLDIRIHGLPVAVFRSVEVRRIGDPLFGDLRRLGALAGARFALIPVDGGYVPTPTGDGRVEVAAALLDTHTGRVLWFGVVGGEHGAPGAPAVTASAARALARALFP